MTTVREAGLSRPEAGLDPRMTANGAPKEEEECHVSQKLAVLQEESLKRTLGNSGVEFYFLTTILRFLYDSSMVDNARMLEITSQKDNQKIIGSYCI